MGYETAEYWARINGHKVMAHHGGGDLTTVAPDGKTYLVIFPLSGDCCSRSDFTDDKQFDELVGSVITSIESRGGKSSGAPDDEEDEDGDIIKWHFLVFTTNKGHVTIDWRNASNGYYDGSISMDVEET